MMRTTTLRSALAIFLTVGAAGCADSAGPIAPASPIVTDPVPAPQPPRPQPVGSVVGVYANATPVQHPLQQYTLASRFVLREDGTFSLEYPSGAYRGTYSVRNDEVLFEWDGWSAGGATGTLTERTLTVRYNLFMLMSDFEDAVYTRTP